MKIIGLCGGSGSGKGTACAFFEEFGIKCIDTDKIYHDIVSSGSECLNDLVSVFGKRILNSKGTLDRGALAQIVFSDKQLLNALNRITHAHILAEVRRLIDGYEKDGRSGVVVDAPLLFESGFNNECDFTVCIVSDVETRIERIMSRDGITRDMAVRRISSQYSDDWLSRKCDFTIENNGNTDDLRSSVIKIKRKIFDN